jgi:hypothetical protein
VKVRFTPDARQSIRYKRAWWQEHRNKAPKLFLEELRAIVGKLRVGADEGRQQYLVRRDLVVWRILMPKTKNHLYYRVDATAEEVEVLIVWNAVGGAGPDFSF